MSVIRIRRTIDSSTLYLPELTPLVGHTVEIVIEDQSKPEADATLPGTGDWDGFRQAAGDLRERFDFDAIADQDARDMQDANEQLK